MARLTADLANNAVTSPKVKNGSLLSADFAPGQLPAGPQGLKGDAGAAGTNGTNGTNGAPGAPGSSGISGYHPIGPCTEGGPNSCTYTFSPAANTDTYGELACPTGKKVLGGGFSLISNGLTLQQSYPK
jgi:hypothetical protein